MSGIHNMMVGNFSVASGGGPASIGSPTTFTLESGGTATISTGNNCMGYAANTDKWAIAYFHQGSGGNLRGRAISISNDVVTVGSEVTYNSGDNDSPQMVYNATEGKIALTWLQDDANEPARIKHLTMNANNTITQSGTLTIESGNLADPFVAWDSTENRYLVVYEEDDGSDPNKYRVINPNGGGTPTTASGIYTLPTIASGSSGPAVYAPEIDRVYSVQFDSPTYYAISYNVSASSATAVGPTSVATASTEINGIMVDDNLMWVSTVERGYFLGYLNNAGTIEPTILTFSGTSMTKVGTYKLPITADSGYNFSSQQKMTYDPDMDKILLATTETDASNNYKIKVHEFSPGTTNWTLDNTFVVETGNVSSGTTPYPVEFKYGSTQKRSLLWTKVNEATNTQSKFWSYKTTNQV